MFIIFLLLLVVPVVMHTVLRWLVRTGRIETYSDAEVQAMYRREYPNWYRLLSVYLVLGIALPLAAGVAFIYGGMWSHWLPGLLGTAVAPNAVFFNPWPAVQVVAFLGGIVVMYTGFAFFSGLRMLLPTNMQAYLAHLGDKHMPHLRAVSANTLVSAIAAVVCGLAFLGIIAALPLYTAVSAEDIRYIRSYPAHARVALHDIQMVQIVCTVSKDAGGRQHPWVEVTAKTAKHDISLVGASDGPLPLPYIANDDIRHLVDLADQKKIVVIQAADPGCAAAAKSDPAVRAQYEAFFKK